MKAKLSERGMAEASAALLGELQLRDVGAVDSCLCLARALGALIGTTFCGQHIPAALARIMAEVTGTALTVNRETDFDCPDDEEPA